MTTAYQENDLKITLLLAVDLCTVIISLLLF